MGSSRLLSPQDGLSSGQSGTLSAVHAQSCDGETTTLGVVVFFNGQASAQIFDEMRFDYVGHKE
jgi:hypothetical protein